MMIVNKIILKTNYTSVFTEITNLIIKLSNDVFYTRAPGRSIYLMIKYIIRNKSKYNHMYINTYIKCNNIYYTLLR